MLDPPYVTRLTVAAPQPQPLLHGAPPKRRRRAPERQGCSFFMSQSVSLEILPLFFFSVLKEVRGVSLKITEDPRGFSVGRVTRDHRPERRRLLRGTTAVAGRGGRTCSSSDLQDAAAAWPLRTMTRERESLPRPLPPFPSTSPPRTRAPPSADSFVPVFAPVSQAELWAPSGGASDWDSGVDLGASGGHGGPSLAAAAVAAAAAAAAAGSAAAAGGSGGDGGAAPAAPRAATRAAASPPSAAAWPPSVPPSPAPPAATASTAAAAAAVVVQR